MEGRALAPTAYCLGQPSHTLSDKTIVCSLCRCLKAQITIGPYQVLQRIGKGRSGDTYIAKHLRLQQLAVLKLFPPDNGSRPLWEAARREIHTVADLKHPAILPVFQCALWNPQTQSLSSPASFASPAANTHAEMTAEYLLTICQFAPFSLAQVIEDGSVMFDASIFQTQTPEPLAWAVNLITVIGDILSLTHSTGIIHGALVPGNILYAPKHFWLADFGLAGLHPPLPPYLAPELDSEIYYARDDQKFISFWNARSPASDQYALAMTYKRLFDTILPQEINHSTTSILHKATNINPQGRFANIAQLTQALIEQLAYKHAIPLVIQQETAIAVRQNTQSPQPTQQNNWEEKGNQAFRAHNYKLAVQEYHQATTLHPLNPLLWAALGDSLFATKQIKEAVQAYNKSLRLNPIQADIWMNRGTALERLGHRQEALVCYKRAAKLRHQR